MTTHLKKLEERLSSLHQGFCRPQAANHYRVTAKGRSAFERYSDGLEALVRQGRK